MISLRITWHFSTPVVLCLLTTLFNALSNLSVTVRSDKKNFFKRHQPHLQVSLPNSGTDGWCQVFRRPWRHEVQWDMGAFNCTYCRVVKGFSSQYKLLKVEPLLCSCITPWSNEDAAIILFLFYLLFIWIPTECKCWLIVRDRFWWRLLLTVFWHQTQQWWDFSLLTHLHSEKRRFKPSRDIEWSKHDPDMLVIFTVQKPPDHTSCPPFHPSWHPSPTRLQKAFHSLFPVYTERQL